MPDDGRHTESPTLRLLGWSVHALTASGAVIGVLALTAAARGEFATAALWMLVAWGIDAVDGTLARAVRVSETIPTIDGRRLDDIVDYLNFVVVPVVFLIELDLLHWSLGAFAALASAYGFAQTDAKTEDDFFLGWPSYWNVVAVYLWLLEVTPAVASAWVALFAVLVFVPLKYIYPTKLRRFRTPMVVGGTLWTWALAAIVLFPQSAARWHAAEISLVYPVLYIALSAWLGGWGRSS